MDKDNVFYILFYLCTLNRTNMSAKKKKQSNSPLRVIIILVLLGLLAYNINCLTGNCLKISPLSKAMKKSQKY